MATNDEQNTPLYEHQRQILQDCWRSYMDGTYAQEVTQDEAVLYTQNHLKSHPKCRLRRDLPPFIMGGRPDGAKVVTIGINPRASESTQAVCSLDAYMHNAFNHFARVDFDNIPKSRRRRWRFHLIFFDMLKGLLDQPMRDAFIQEFYYTFDLVPHHCRAWSVSTTKPRAALLQRYFKERFAMLAAMDVRLVILNGKPLCEPLLKSSAEERAFETLGVVPYADVTGLGGEAYVGRLKLGERTVPAVVLSRQVQSSRLGFKAGGREELGRRVRQCLQANQITPSLEPQSETP